MKETEDLKRARARQAECIAVINQHWPEVKPLLEEIAALKATRIILREGKGIISLIWNEKVMKVLVTCEPPIADCFESSDPRNRD